MVGRKKPVFKKSRDQRFEDLFRTKERLEERRGMKFHADRVFEPPEAPSSRSFFEYQSATGVDFEKLFKGKRVLDVACGMGVFVKQAMEKGILAEGIDPTAFRPNEHIHRIHLDEFNPKQKYSCVVSMFGLPFYSRNAYNVRLSLYHMLRLVEPGGMLVIHPWHPEKPKNRQARAMWAITGSTLRKLTQLRFVLDFTAPTYHPNYGTLIIKKKDEIQVMALGQRLGIVESIEKLRKKSSTQHK